MIKLVLTRGPSTDDGTFGLLEGEAFRLFTGELPDRGNRRQKSCILKGVYRVIPRFSGKYGKHFLLLDVEGRSYILIHSGNYCGDRDKGKRSDVLGCVLIGMAVGIMNGQKVILRSREAMQKLREYTNWEEFELEII